MWQQELKTLYSLNRKQVAGLEKLLELLKASKDRGLTAVTGDLNIVHFHFFDSLCLLGIDELASASSVIDVGSGAGFPGLPLALSRPDMHFTLLDSSSKKCDFLRMAVATLELQNVDVVNARSEEAVSTGLRDNFDAALARALGPLATLIEYTLPFVKAGGFAVLQRGADRPGDEETAAKVAARLNGSLSRVLPVFPYPEAKNLNVWVFSKTSMTPTRFPRKPGLARKRPLS